jgi:hypothetical protein
VLAGERPRALRSGGAMKAHVKSYLSRPARPLRSVVVTLPSNYPKNMEWMNDRQWDRWFKTSCNKEKLKRFGAEICRKFQLAKPRVRITGLSRRVACFIYVYEGAGTPAEKALFKKVSAYVEKHAPMASKDNSEGRMFA